MYSTYRLTVESVKYKVEAMIFPLPNWVLDVPEGPEKERAVDRFLLQLACVYASRRGSVRILSELIDVNYQTLKSQISGQTNRVPYTTCTKVEQLLGPSFQRHDIRKRLVG